MNREKLFVAIEVLHELSHNVSALPEEQSKAADAWFTLADATLYLTELAHHLSRGKEPYDALLGAVRGEMLLSTKTLAPVMISTSPC